MHSECRLMAPVERIEAVGMVTNVRGPGNSGAGFVRFQCNFGATSVFTVENAEF